MAVPQVVLITGTSTGFGKLFAETLAHHGHRVYATMRDPAVRNAANASALRTLAGKEGATIEVLEMDVADEVSVDRAVHACVQQAGRIDAVINNAGYSLSGLAEATTVDQVRTLMDTNFLGCVRVNRAVLPFMRKQRSGLLLHVSSVGGRMVVPGFAFYCASKFALEAMAETYHYELAGQGIESCLLEPGAYQTAVFENRVTAADHARTSTYGPVAAMPEKIAAVLSSSAANAQDVADLVLRIVETPAGQRQLRYLITANPTGVDEINSVSAKVQAAIVENFGLQDATRFNSQSASSAST